MKGLVSTIDILGHPIPIEYTVIHNLGPHQVEDKVVTINTHIELPTSPALYLRDGEMIYAFK